jgi:steroid delta-isomerase-like uncharacterized protein
MSESNAAVVRRAIELYNAGDWDALDPWYDPIYVHHNNAAVLTLAQYKRGSAWFRTAMPDFQLTIDDLVSQGDRVAIRITGRGTHRGSMFGEAPTGKALTVYGIVMFRVSDGRIVEDWEALDEQYLREQVAGPHP